MLIAVRGPFTVYTAAPSYFWSPSLLSTTGLRGTLRLISLGTLASAVACLVHLSALLRSSPSPSVGVQGMVGAGRRWAGRRRGTYRRQVGAVAGVFRAVPSYGGSALCRLDMATVFEADHEA